MNIRSILTAVLVSLICTSSPGEEPSGPPTFVDDFSENKPAWRPFTSADRWAVEDGHLTPAGEGDTGWVAGLDEASDAVVETKLQTTQSPRCCFGVLLRVEGESGVMVRYYDQFRGLQILRYEDGRVTGGRSRSRRIDLEPGRWYRMKVAVVSTTVLAKIWPDGDAEPDWQLDVDLAESRPIADDGREVPPTDPARLRQHHWKLPKQGCVGLARHDATTVVFDVFRLWTAGPAVDGVRTAMSQRHQGELEKVGDRLRLQIVPSTFPHKKAGGLQRRLEFVPVADNDRLYTPLAASLEVTVDDRTQRYEIAPSDWDEEAYAVDVPEPTTPVEVRARLAIEGAAAVKSETMLEPGKWLPWREYVRRSLDTLLAHGTDRYGSEHTPLFMSIIDVKTLTAPHVPKLYDGFVRTEGRRHRRSEGGANLWNDAGLLRVLYRMSQVSGDAKYATAADSYLEYAMEHCVNRRKGLFVWGSHAFWDAYTEAPGGDVRGGEPVHEFLVHQALWPRMYEIDPEAVRRHAEGVWEWHVQDKETGLHNRHDSPDKGDFSFSAGSLCILFCNMYEQTGQDVWLDRALLIAKYHDSVRNPKTGLAPTAPFSRHTPHYFNGHHASTQLVGPFAAQLLRCYELTGREFFREMAVTHIKAYDKYGWDESAGQYFGALRMDGTPLLDKKEFHNYFWAPDGYVDVWRTIVFSWEFPLMSAQAALYAYELSNQEPGGPDPELLQIARHWAAGIENALPPRPGRRFKPMLEATMPAVVDTQGTYAENYARAISFYVHLSRQTRDPKHLNLAEKLAREAVEKLYENGLFKGHPAKPYYDALDGSGYLLYALLELDAPDDDLPAAF